MAVTVHIKYGEEFSLLTSRFPMFSFLKYVSIPRNSSHCWNTNYEKWGYKDKTTYSFQVMFIGKTGYGKSTTLNKIVGQDVFDTDDVSVCTKDLYEAKYRIDTSIPSFIDFCDLPGVGESNYADNDYYRWYKEMLEMSDVVIYVIRADQRGFAVDEHIFKNLFDTSEKKNKVILALNYADKVEPVNRSVGLSVEQIKSLERKIDDIAGIFNVLKKDIVYYSATDKINIYLLMEKISQKLKKVHLTTE